MSQPWPPPPDLASIQELVATADIEGYIAEGGQPDEYETEADLVFDGIRNFPADDLIPGNILPVVEQVWARNFNLSFADLERRQPALAALAGQIARFFGPEAKPQVRAA